MEFNNVILVFSTALAATLMLIGAAVTLFYYQRRKNSLILLFSLSWAFQGVMWTLISLSHLLYSTSLMATGFILQCIGVFLLFCFLELIETERLHPVKLVVLTLIETLYLVFIFSPESMKVLPGYGIHISGWGRVFQIIFILYYTFIFLSWSFKTWRKAPKELRSTASVLLLGSIIFSLVALIFYIIGTFLGLFNALGFIVHSLGALITVVAISRDPRIIYILPFRANRLTVFETKGGLSLFTYQWAPLTELDEGFFSMVLQAISNILGETIGKGAVREIHLEEAVLLIQHDKVHPIASVLVASSSNTTLKLALKQFNDRFIQKYPKCSEVFHDISRFDEATVLVEDIFDFIPKYRKPLHLTL